MRTPVPESHGTARRLLGAGTRAALAPRRTVGFISSMSLESLKTRPVEKLPERVRLSGRVLFLVDDAELIRRQLGGADLAWPSPAALRHDISTQEITPPYICY